MSAPVFGEDTNQDHVRGDDNDDDNTRDDDFDDDDTRDDLSIDIHRSCSNRKSEEGGNILLASKVNLAILDYSGKSVCSDTKDYKSDLINKKNLTLQINCALAQGNYVGVFYAPNLNATPSEKTALGDFRLSVEANGRKEIRGSKIKVIYAYNIKEDADDVPPESIGQDQTRCESFESPLVVRLKNKPLKLSAPLDGILFDVLGDKGSGKKQISWPIDDTIGFIALPDAQGSVHSINQLFGNNTKGPDGHFAEDGYAALAKYDLNADGRIDAKDAVYSKLKIFVDYNRDGISDATELSSLDANDIQSISLNFDPNYSEEDAYGNKIMFKSVAETSGEPLLVFDIWFRLVD